MKIFIFSILLVFTSSFSYACEREWSYESYSNIHTVEGPYSIEQIENKHTHYPVGNTESVPFGSSNKKWLKFKEIYMLGDELYYLKKESGKYYLERYIIVRGKCIVDRFLVSSMGMID